MLAMILPPVVQEFAESDLIEFAGRKMLALGYLCLPFSVEIFGHFYGGAASAFSYKLSFLSLVTYLEDVASPEDSFRQLLLFLVPHRCLPPDRTISPTASVHFF